MKDKFKILVITNQLLTTCGVSKHLLYFLTEAKKNLGFSFTIVCSGGDAVEKYKNLYDEIIILPESKHENRSVLNFIKSVISLAKLQSKNRFDLIHCHTHYSANLINFVSKFYKVKSLQTVHGIMDPVGRLNHYPAQYFISVNEHVHDFLIKNKKISTDKVKLIRNGILFNEKLLSQDKTKFKIISAGRLIKQKGFETYIKAISLLDEVTKRKAEFYLAGKGEEQNNLINLSKSLNVPLNFVGEIENLKGFLSTTHIFVNPSKSSNEGFAMTIIEAGYAKNLVISSIFLSVQFHHLICIIFVVQK